MASIAIAWPVLPGKLEAWRQLCAELQGARREEYEASARQSGSIVCRLFYQQTPDADLVISYLEAADLGRMFKDMATSQDPYDVWFRAKMVEIHGWDMTRPPAGPQPELVLEWQDR